MISLRRALQTTEDVKTYVALQEGSWGLEGMATPVAVAEGRFTRCSDSILFAERNGIVIGTTTMILLTDYDFGHPMSWNAATGHGTCNTHDPNGRTWFGVDLSAGGHLEVVDLLMIGCMQVIIESGTKYGVLGSRMTGFAGYIRRHPELDPTSVQVAEDYLRSKRNGKYIDRQVRMYDKIPGLKMIGLIPDYFDDPKSLNYGVLWRWRNHWYRLPFRHLIKHLPLLAYRVADALSRAKKSLFLK